MAEDQLKKPLAECSTIKEITDAYPEFNDILYKYGGLYALIGLNTALNPNPTGDEIGDAIAKTRERLNEERFSKTKPPYEKMEEILSDLVPHVLFNEGIRRDYDGRLYGEETRYYITLKTLFDCVKNGTPGLGGTIASTKGMKEELNEINAEWEKRKDAMKELETEKVVPGSKDTTQETAAYETPQPKQVEPEKVPDFLSHFLSPECDLEAELTLRRLEDAGRRRLEDAGREAGTTKGEVIHRAGEPLGAPSADKKEDASQETAAYEQVPSLDSNTNPSDKERVSEEVGEDSKKDLPEDLFDKPFHGQTIDYRDGSSQGSFGGSKPRLRIRWTSFVGAIIGLAGIAGFLYFSQSDNDDKESQSSEYSTSKASTENDYSGLGSVLTSESKDAKQGRLEDAVQVAAATSKKYDNSKCDHNLIEEVLLDIYCKNSLPKITVLDIGSLSELSNTLLGGYPLSEGIINDIIANPEEVVALYKNKGGNPDCDARSVALLSAPNLAWKTAGNLITKAGYKIEGANIIRNGKGRQVELSLNFKNAYCGGKK